MFLIIKTRHFSTSLLIMSMNNSLNICQKGMTNLLRNNQPNIVFKRKRNGSTKKIMKVLLLYIMLCSGVTLKSHSCWKNMVLIFTPLIPKDLLSYTLPLKVTPLYLWYFFVLNQFYYLNKGLKISVTDSKGSTPLHWACYSGQ